MAMTISDLYGNSDHTFNQPLINSLGNLLKLPNKDSWGTAMQFVNRKRLSSGCFIHTTPPSLYCLIEETNYRLASLAGMRLGG